MKAVILDRDGVINTDSDNYIRSVEEWQPIPGSVEAIARLSRSGWVVAVCTNQSGIARGYFSRRTLDKMHAQLRALVEAEGGHIDGIFVCPHNPEAGCSCRKPRAGLLRQAARALGLTLQDVPVIGDAARDLEAARAVNARPILVLTGKGERTLQDGIPEGTAVYADLATAVDALLGTGSSDLQTWRRNRE